ncbi:unnamed protein product [marine sediment metagenome]|uniref:Methyltransferase domain-containing protein n=1 Tax=marine sediment metagenome TaxID=412755 RepID=X0XAN7_9ZZZZ
MPSSRPDTIIPVLDFVRATQPKRILDIGMGDGFYGTLFRRELDGNVLIGKGFHKPEAWQVYIEGIEIFEDYITDAHRYVYDIIQIGNILNDFDKLMEEYEKFNFDLIFMGDVIEHMKLDQGKDLLKKLHSYLNPGCHILVITPNYKIQWHDETIAGNKHEAHLSLWNIKDFDPGYWKAKGFDCRARIIGKKLLGRFKKIG